jgi:K+-transporting ATPase ATPase C chain
MLKDIRPAIVLLAAFTVLTGLAYPAAVAGLAQLFFPSQANGSLVLRDGKVVGSALLGQDVTSPRFFHPRPSATTATDPADAARTIPAPYNAANSAGSNLAPTSKALADLATLRSESPGTPIPADLVTTSASGLDPDISPAAALFQAPRIARARGLAANAVRDLIAAHTEERWLGLLGEPRVNVLALNLALDRLAPPGPK